MWYYYIISSLCLMLHPLLVDIFRPLIFYLQFHRDLLVLLSLVSIIMKEIAVSGNFIPLHALASALRASSKLITSSSPNQGRVLRANSKRRALDDKKNANLPKKKKKRALLKDITNVTSHNSYTTSCLSAAKLQVLYIYTMHAASS